MAARCCLHGLEWVGAVTIARHRTALLPGGATTTVIDSGPFARSRNPLYLGLLAGAAGVALLAGSLWALIALPSGVGAAQMGRGHARRTLPGGEVRDGLRRVRQPGPALAVTAVAVAACFPAGSGIGRGHSPVAPSIDSRIRSAWPLWRAYSSIMWTMIQRRLNGVALAAIRSVTRRPARRRRGPRR